MSDTHEDLIHKVGLKILSLTGVDLENRYISDLIVLIAAETSTATLEMQNAWADGNDADEEWSAMHRASALWPQGVSKGVRNE